MAFACGTFALSKFALGFGEIMEAKFRFAHQYQLGYVFLAAALRHGVCDIHEVWAVGMTRTTLSLLANAARSGARLGRPDQHIYRIMGPQYKAQPRFRGPLVAGSSIRAHDQHGTPGPLQSSAAGSVQHGRVDAFVAWTGSRWKASVRGLWPT